MDFLIETGLMKFGNGLVYFLATWHFIFSAAVATLALLFISKFSFPRLGLVDKPHDYGLTRKPIPYSVGWVFLPITLLLTTFFVQSAHGQLTDQLISVLAAGTLIMFVSFLDDRYRISPFIRLGTQITAALIVIFGGLKIQIISNPFGTPFFLDSLSFTLAGQTIWIISALVVIAWLVLMMNVVNWLDGVPGLASGVSTITFITLLILALEQFHVIDQTLLIILSSGLAASTFVFWICDFHPPKILMGDTGSMFLGFMIGVLSILAGGKMATALLVMGFPILDAFIVIVRRMLKGNSPFKGDFTHLHHRLLKSGLSERKTLIFIYIVCILCGAAALFLPTTLLKIAAFGVIGIGMAIVQKFVTRL